MRPAKYGPLLTLLVILVSCATTGNPRQSGDPWTALTHVSYGAAKEQYADMTIPKTPGEKTDVILFIHGYNGGKMENWTFLNTYREDFVVANVNYRAISASRNNLTMDDLLTDIANALSVIKRRAADNGITIDKAIIMGHSLGGFLALNYSYRYFDQDPPVPVAFCVSLAGLSDIADVNWIRLARNPFRWIRFNTILLLASSLTGQTIPRDAITKFGFAGPVIQHIKEISPRYCITEGIPPTIIVHAAGDTVVPYSNSASLHGALDAAGAPNILIGTSNYLNHCFGASPVLRTKNINSSVEKELVRAIDQYIGLYCDGGFPALQ